MRFISKILRLFGAGAAAMLLSFPVWAQSNETLLTVALDKGAVETLDLDALRAMPQNGFTTTTIWTDGPQEFTGVRLADLLVTLAADGARITLIAANGYRVDRPVADLRPEDALIAYFRNGEAMSLRDKGPLWLVYAYDSDPSLRTEAIYANSIWQLDRIEIAR